MDEVAFRRMDSRVASLPLFNYPMNHPILTTHQEIVAELGSSREVISRILEDIATQGAIRSTPGVIEVLNASQLQKRSIV